LDLSDDVTGKWRRLIDEERHDPYCSLELTSVILEKKVSH